MIHGLTRWFKKRPAKSAPPSERPVQDVTRFAVQAHAYLAVYWKDLETGLGPGLSLYIYEQEVLRFDCLGKSKGHYHTNLLDHLDADRGDGSRLLLSESTVPEQTDRALFELQYNAQYHIRRNQHKLIASFDLDTAKIAELSGELKRKMLEIRKERQF